MADPEFSSTRSFLSQVLESTSTWEADFVNAARHHAIAVYRPELSEADDLWSECENIYGYGGGFRDSVVRKLSDWFDNHDELQDELERRTRRAWTESFLKPLANAAGDQSRSRES